jgi:hypothetical protein
VTDQPNIETQERSPSSLAVIQHFSEESGRTPEEVADAFGDIGNDFDLPPQVIVDRYFPPSDEGEKLRRRLIEGYEKYVDRIPDKNKALSYFWRDVLVNLMHQPHYREKYFEKWYPVVALNGLTSAKDSVEHWKDTEVPLVADSMERHYRTGFGLLKESLKPGETVESRLAKTQSGLEKAQEIGREILSGNKVPLTRIMFFRTEEEKNTFIDNASGDEFFSSRYPDRLANHTLKDVEEHTEAPEENSPLTSWTYNAASEPYKYGLGSIGRSHAVMIVSEIGWDEVVWARNLTEGSTWHYREVFRWYDKPTVYPGDIGEAETIDLTDLTKKNLKGALVPTEGETVVWSKIPVKGVIDLGP